MSRGKVVAVGVFVALVRITSAWAQTVSSTTGAINGKVVDESGGGVPGVTVTIASASMQGIRTTVTGEDGTYPLPGDPAGRLQASPTSLQASGDGGSRRHSSSASGLPPPSTPR